MAAEAPLEPPKPNKTRFIIYRADSEYESSQQSSFTQAASIMAGSSISTSKRHYIEAESGRKDIFFIFLFIIVFISFLGICGYGCFLAYEPLIKASTFSYGLVQTDVLSLQTILAQIFTTALLAGIISMITNAILSTFPKAIYQAAILSAPIIYLAIAAAIGYIYGAKASAFLLFVLFAIHAIYLIARKKHIRMYRYLMMESVKIGTLEDRYFTPLLLWAFMLLFTGFAMTGAFGQFKVYLDKYDSNGTLYAFFFSIIVLGWLWTVNLIRNQYKMVVSGLCLNELLREGSLHENPEVLKSKLWKYVWTRFLGQALHSAFIISLAELFVLMILFMRYENISNLISYMFLLVTCQHIVSFVFKQTGLIHNIMFGSSFFDGTFDVYIPFVFYDELCGHVISLILLVVVGGSCAIVGKMATVYFVGKRVRETSILLAMVSGYISLIINEIFFDYSRTAVLTHIISYGENPIVLSRTSPAFTEAVRVLKIGESQSIMEAS
jgi:hypothetical protein